MSKARITYRFDGNERADAGRKGTRVPGPEEKVIPLYQEEFKVIDSEIRDPRKPDEITPFHQAEREQVENLFEPHSLNTFTTDFGSWTSQFETEGERVERIIRDSQAAREQQESHEVPSTPQRPEPITERNRDEWSTWTQQGPYIEEEIGPRYSKSGGTPWIGIATSVAGAVVTGIAFGFFVLSMFSSDGTSTDTASGNNTIAVPTANAQAAVPSKAPGGATKTEQNSTVPATAAAVTPVQIPAKSYSFLQNGVFSSLQGAQIMLDTLKKKGLASALDSSDKPTVFVGFAKSKDDATALRQQVQTADKTIEVYIKSLDIPAATGIRWSGLKPEAVPSFIAEGDKLVGTINELAVIHLAETKPTALSDSSLQTIHASHQSLTTLTASLNEGLGDDAKPIVQKMTSSLNSAVQSMDEYKKSPSTAMLWQAQTSMMQYILAQKELLKKISVS